MTLAAEGKVLDLMVSVEDWVIDHGLMMHWALAFGPLVFCLLPRRLGSQLANGSRSRHRLVLTKDTISLKGNVRGL